MSMFGNLNVPQNVVKETDSLGGFQVLESGLYKALIQQAYGTESRNGAKGLVVKFEIQKANGDKVPFTTTFWVTNKEGSVTYQDKEGKQHYLMGFNQANAICLGATGKQLMELPNETRVLKIFNYQERKEVDTQVQVLPDLLGKTIALGLLKTRENKTVQVGNEYVPTQEEVFRNNVDKIFILKDEAAYTQNELEANAAPEFAVKWSEKWTGQVQDRYKQVSGAASGTTTTALDIG